MFGLVHVMVERGSKYGPFSATGTVYIPLPPMEWDSGKLARWHTNTLTYYVCNATHVRPPIDVCFDGAEGWYTQWFVCAHLSDLTCDPTTPTPRTAKVAVCNKLNALREQIFADCDNFVNKASRFVTVQSYTLRELYDVPSRALPHKHLARWVSLVVQTSHDMRTQAVYTDSFLCVNREIVAEHIVRAQSVAPVNQWLGFLFDLFRAQNAHDSVPYTDGTFDVQPYLARLLDLERNSK